jgi:hypothetical protein
MKEIKARTKKFLSIFLLLALTATIVLFAIGCNGKYGEANVTTAPESAEDAPEVRGEGNTEFSFKVVTADGVTKEFTVKTDKAKVGDALFEAGLIKGENGQFGLYVTEVDGEYHKYEEDGMYWAFYENESYAALGVDSTEINTEIVYSLRASKG